MPFISAGLAVDKTKVGVRPNIAIFTMSCLLPPEAVECRKSAAELIDKFRVVPLISLIIHSIKSN